MNTTYETATRNSNSGLPDGCTQGTIDDGPASLTWSDLSKAEQRRIDLEYFDARYHEIIEMLELDPAYGPELIQSRAESLAEINRLDGRGA
jgi:hypothetical protein